jgi:hypothetical protein
VTDTAPEPSEYLPEPEFDDVQDDEHGDLLTLARTLVTPTAPNDLGATITWFRGQITHRSQDWTNACQKFSRTGPGCPGGAASALDAFFNCPREYRIVGGDPTKVEPGWQLVSRSNNSGSTMAKFGHIHPVVFDFTGGKQRGISTDALRRGWPDYVHSPDLFNAWNHDYLGAIRWQNGLILDVKDPKPVQDQKYERLADSLVDFERALRDLRAARDAAKAREDWHDRDAINTLIARTVAVKGDVRAAYETLRRIA